MEPTTSLPTSLHDPRRHTRRHGRAPVTAVAAALALVALLPACADGTSPGSSGSTDDASTGGTTPGSTPDPAGLELSAGSTAPGLPDGAGPAPADAAAGAGRTADDGLLHVVTFGSSSCPAVPDATAEASGPAAVTLTFPEPGTGPCTADFVPTTTVVALPDGTDPTSDLVVTIGSTGDVTLPVGSTDLVWVLPAG